MSVKTRRSDVTTEIVVGAFMFVILVVLLTISVVISQNKFFEKSYTMRVNFHDIGGLKTGEPVFLRGVRIGNINRITVPERGRGVDLELRLQRPVELYEDYRFIIESSSMLGGMRLVIEEGSEGGTPIPEQAYERLKGQPISNLMGEATETLKMIREALVDDGILEDVKAFTSNIRQISTKLNEGEGSIARLINEGSVYEDLSASMADVRGFTENARKIAERLEQGQGVLGKLLSEDEVMYDDLRKLIASLREFSENLSDQRGTLGLLINEDGLYRKVESLVDEARATLDDFRETSPITTFGSIFFGAF